MTAAGGAAARKTLSGAPAPAGLPFAPPRPFAADPRMPYSTRQRLPLDAESEAVIQPQYGRMFQRGDGFLIVPTG